MTPNGDSGRGHKILKQSSGLRMKGRGVITAWQPGVINAYMRGGLELADAMRAAHLAGMAVYKVEDPNLITTVGKALVGDFLIDDEDGGITICAIGTVSTPPNVSDTVLGGEVKRKTITSRTRAGNEINLSTYFLASESGYQLEEVGMFGGTTAGTVVDTGVLFSHFTQSYDNSGNVYDLTYEYILTITEG